MGDLKPAPIEGSRGRRGLGFPVHLVRFTSSGWTWLCGDVPDPGDEIDWVDGHVITCKYCDRRDRFAVIDGGVE